MKDVMDLIARVMISFIFLYEAYDSIKYFGATKEVMNDYGITWNQDFLLSASILVLILGGVLILMGYRSGFGATLLLLYWIPVTFVVHSFWNDAEQFRRAESMEFMKNIAIIGGLLMILVNGSGRFSIRRLFATTRVPFKR